MSPFHIQKRDASSQLFDHNKITQAIRKAMQAKNTGSQDQAELIALRVAARLDAESHTQENNIWSVEAIQDVVEDELMKSDFHEVAKAYIIYRAARQQERKKDIFKKRVALKPFEYPQLHKYTDAIRHSYWIHTEFNYTSDIQDFKINVTAAEKEAIKRTMLAIWQIEVAVKSFWGDIYKRFPKAEIGAVWATFAESEVRHMDAYSHLLEILGLNGDFEKLSEVPAMKQRIDYLQSSLSGSKSVDDAEYAHSLMLFSLFIEHVSLFSQFLIMMAFNKHKNLFKWISNVVEATSKEEQIHGLFGIDLINIIKDEHPEWFGADYQAKVSKACQKAYNAESWIVDWIFENGELDFLPKHIVKEFIKNRFNNSLEAVWVDKLFDIQDEIVQETDWFDDEIIATKRGDFFDKRQINYNKKSKSVTADDLF